MRDSATPPLPPDLAAWIGRTSQRTDVVSSRLARSFRAMLAPHLAATPGAPLGVLWCLAPDIVESGELGPDGHPRVGLVLPAMSYTRRMWAGGELVFHGTVAVGDEVVKTSTVADIAFKTGSTGGLAFVTIRHQYRVGDRLVLAELQDIVYRDAEGTGSKRRPPPEPESAGEVLKAWTVTTDPTLLFRYSALTFNAHRIHYDRPYATEREGYEGLVVHSPMQATLLLNLAAEVMGAVPRRFSYRGHAPLIRGAPARLEAVGREAGVGLRVLDQDGTMTMSAIAGSMNPAAERRPCRRAPNQPD